MAQAVTPTLRKSAMSKSYNLDRYPNADYTPNDMGGAEAGRVCFRCGNEWDAFNHTEANCKKNERWQKLEDVALDTI